MAPNPWLVSAASLAALLLPGAATAALGQKMTAWKDPKMRDLRISEDRTTVVLEADSKTLANGTYGIVMPGTHIVVGEVLRHDADTAEVTRQILRWTGILEVGATRGSWTGQAFSSPEELHLDFEEVQLAPGALPAWVFHPGTPSADVWAIHVHGLRSSRQSMLRSVESATRLGLTSIVPSYYGDAENHAQGQVSHYGSLEAEDVDKALAYAVERGAKAVYLFGWSMGATISLLLTETSANRHVIAGLVLVSPGPNTEAVIFENARTAGLPRAIAKVVPRILSTPGISRLASLTKPVDFDALDWTHRVGRLRTPALVLHSRGDTEVPFELSAQFATSNPETVKLLEFPPVPHQCEWNSAPARFEDEIAAWITDLESRRAKGQS
jgi:pimeloyl-ACP methyl ester carboxylesterase